MDSPDEPRPRRRDVLAGGTKGLTAAGVASVLPGTVGAAAPGQPAGRGIDAVEAGADPSGRSDSSAALQRAIDTLAPIGGVLWFPPGTYRIDRTLVWRNDENARKPGITFQGAGLHSTTLVSRVRSGPLLAVRGVPRSGHVDTTYFWGGGIRDLTLRGEAGGPEQHGLEVLGWYYGEIYNCRITGFGGDGIRAQVDLRLDPNPDWTSSTLFLRGVWIERVGGWGFNDLSREQGAPAWSWDRCVFAFCRKGGALVRSGAHSYIKCSFAQCGAVGERDREPLDAFGLFFDGALTANCQHMVEGCEFDTNRGGHIGARFLSGSSFLNNRFIYNDRLEAGRIWPRIAVSIGVGDANAAVRGVQFRQSFFRIDTRPEEQAVGFAFLNTANVRDIDISGSFFSVIEGGRFERYGGHAVPGSEGFGFRIVDQS